MKRLAANVRWGVTWGLVFAVVYMGWALIVFTLGGSTPFEAKSTTLGAVLLAYLMGGISGGAVVGLLRPLVRWRWGAVFVGVVAAIPITLGFTAATIGLRPWTGEQTFMLVTMSLVLGGPGGFILHAIFRED